MLIFKTWATSFSVCALGTGVGDSFNLNNLRYGKIILLMDADADGHHITTLMLTFFFRFMPELIRKEHLFIAQPPLYRIDVGKETYWAKDDAHKEEIIEQMSSIRQWGGKFVLPIPEVKVVE